MTTLSEYRRILGKTVAVSVSAETDLKSKHMDLRARELEIPLIKRFLNYWKTLWLSVFKTACTDGQRIIKISSGFY